MPKVVQSKRYTGEFRRTVIEDILNNKLSYSETMQKYFSDKANKNFSFLKNWKRTYLEEVDGLNIERRGSACKKDGMAKRRKLYQ